MKKALILLVAAALAPLLAAGPAGAQTFAASGQVTLTVHSHSGAGLLFPTDRLSYNFTPGETFSYSSRPCSAFAPFNEIGLNFIPDYPGVDDDADHAAPSRHHVQGTVLYSAGDRGVIQGRITTVLCEPGPSGFNVESEHSIVSYFTAAFQRVGTNDLILDGGFQFSPTESTGTFRDIRGGGRMHAAITCLSAARNPGAPTCAELGEFHDFVVFTGDPSLPAGQLQPGMFGSFYDPTVETV